jgi:glucose/arabinose dehydrogenase
MKRNPSLLSALLLIALACDGGDGGVDPGPEPTLSFATIAEGLENPVFLTAAPGDSTRLFVIEQEGRIRIIRNDTLLATPFLDIEDSVSHGSEQGLLGLAFAPDYPTSGAFYVFTTDPAGDIRLLRFQVSGDPEIADSMSGVEVLAFDHPESNHNGGMIAFGNDGLLHIASGDGGGGGDPSETGQDPSDLLGAILRIDVSGDSAGYTVPGTNPFVGDSGFAPEVWVYGLRNPWRFSFDRATGDMWIGDVGQNAYEEVDFIPAGTSGQNLGWDLMEGTHCYEPSSGCNTAGLTMPLFDYAQGSTRCSVIGGYVYRGPDSSLSSIVGHYVYGDLCDGRVRVRHDGDEFDSNIGSSILSFGEDLLGRLYVLTGDGEVRRLSGIIFLN